MGNNWIEWNGGECPVPAGTLVDLRYRANAYEDRMAVPALTSGKMSDGDFWQHHSVGCDIIAWRLHQPEQAAWNGEGLPPVGTECEVKRALDWQRCEIIFISEKHAVINIQGSEICWDTQSCQFRPLRTEAERKRDEATIAMHKIWHSVAGQETDGDLISIYDCLYNAIEAGEIPGVKLD